MTRSCASLTAGTSGRSEGTTTNLTTGLVMAAALQHDEHRLHLPASSTSAGGVSSASAAAALISTLPCGEGSL